MGENTTPQTILVVDDSEDIRLLLSQVLEEEGYAVIFAEDGHTALEQTIEHHPALILMDLSLPGMNGWEVVQYLRAMDDFRHTPIIAVTAHVTKEDEARSLAAGCTAHVNKPFDLTPFLEQIHSLLTT